MGLTYLNKLKSRKVALGEDKGLLARSVEDVDEKKWREENADLFMSIDEKPEETSCLQLKLCGSLLGIEFARGGRQAFMFCCAYCGLKIMAMAGPMFSIWPIPLVEMFEACYLDKDKKARSIEVTNDVKQMEWLRTLPLQPLRTSTE